MARPIVLSNGEMHVGINLYGGVHDFYYPYVGLENHAAGKQLRHKIGVYVDGQLSWTDTEHEWEFTYAYPTTALIGYISAKNNTLGVTLELEDAVDSEFCAYMRNIRVINHKDTTRDIKLFTYQAFAIGDSRSNTDTAQFLPDSNAVLHYRGLRSFVISGTSDSGSFDQHTIGVFGIEGREGSYRDAEDGELSNNSVEHGRVDSILRFSLSVEARSAAPVHYWITAGMSTREALYLHKQIVQQGVQTRLHKTAQWWNEWLLPAKTVANKLPERHRDHFLRSVMIVKSHIDKRGAVIASTDSSVLNYSRDTYAYMWPRDGAYTVWPLMRMGYYDEAYRFFSFCQKALHPRGFLHHKYRADGAVGSSWHPYSEGDEIGLPIQEDETAITVFVFAQFYQLTKNNTLIQDFYESMIKPMAHFLSEYIDQKTGLPKPTYDIWEEVRQSTTYTTAVTYGALVAAAELANVAGDKESAVKWQLAADDIAIAGRTHLYNEGKNAFYKGIWTEGESIKKDETIDASSLYGAFMYGLFPISGNEITKSLSTYRGTLGITKDSPGSPRYENDAYRRENQDSTGNWWHVPTLWNAQFYSDSGDSTTALEILDWVAEHMTHTGMLSEQIAPQTGAAIAPLPLTWSHAEYISTLIDTVGNKNPTEAHEE